MSLTTLTALEPDLQYGPDPRKLVQMEKALRRRIDQLQLEYYTYRHDIDYVR